MKSNHALEALGALAQRTRLDVYRLLVKAGPDGIPAGEIADSLRVRQNTLSAHLTVLTQAGLVTRERNGRMIRYEANYANMRELLLFLMQDCCEGNATICNPVVAAMADSN